MVPDDLQKFQGKTDYFYKVTSWKISGENASTNEASTRLGYATGTLRDVTYTCTDMWARRLAFARPWSWQARDSVTPSTLPISDRVRPSK